MLRLGRAAILAALTVGVAGRLHPRVLPGVGQPGRLGSDLREEPRPAVAAGHLLDRAAGALAVRRPLRPGCAAGPARRRGDRGALAGPAVAQQPADRAGGRDRLPGAPGILEAPGTGRRRGRPPAGARRRRTRPSPGCRPTWASAGSRRRSARTRPRARASRSSPSRGWPIRSSPARSSSRTRRSTPTSRPAARLAEPIPNDIMPAPAGPAAPATLGMRTARRRPDGDRCASGRGAAHAAARAPARPIRSPTPASPGSPSRTRRGSASAPASRHLPPGGPGASASIPPRSTGPASRSSRSSASRTAGNDRPGGLPPNDHDPTAAQARIRGRRPPLRRPYLYRGGRRTRRRPYHPAAADLRRAWVGAQTTGPRGGKDRMVARVAFQDESVSGGAADRRPAGRPNPPSRRPAAPARGTQPRRAHPAYRPPSGRPGTLDPNVRALPERARRAAPGSAADRRGRPDEARRGRRARRHPRPDRRRP